MLYFYIYIIKIYSISLTDSNGEVMKDLSKIISEFIDTYSKVDVLQVDDYNCNMLVNDEFNVKS